MHKHGTFRLAALAAAVFASSCSGCRGTGEETAASGETIAVSVQPARLASLRDTVTGTGTVVPSAVGDFVVAASEPAEIVEISKKEGDAVSSGDVLVRLEVASITNDIATKQLELNEATSKLDAAKADEARLEPLVAQGLAARNRLETARAARLVAESNVTQARASFEAAKTREGTTVIRARFAGTVIKRWHNPGEIVAAGETDPILRVIDPARLQVALQVPRAQADRISQGQAATIQTGASTEPGIVAMKGVPAGESATTVEVRVNVMSATPLPLDTQLTVEIVLEDLRDVLVVPAGAVQTGEKGPFVWLAANTGEATKRDVRVGLTSTGLTQIVSGLAVGDQVITTGIAQLAEGTPITIGR